MNTIVNLAMKAMGLGGALDALDGETSKAYQGAVVTILTGAATFIGGLANLAAEIFPLHGGAAYVDFARSLSHDPNLALVLAGLAAIGKGWADIGNRHATAKLANAVAAQAQAPTPAPAVDASKQTMEPGR